jgi:hypothetical protein
MKYFLSLIVIALAACESVSRPPDANMIADIDPISLGSVSMEFDKAFSSALDKKDVVLFFDPRINAVDLQFSFQGIKYHQYWDKKNREFFIAALKRYHEDYDTKNLLTKDSQTRAIYGKSRGSTVWGTFSFSTKAQGYPVLEFGYTFRNDKPYFSVMQAEVEDTLAERSSEGKKKSSRIRTYFTRAQADALAVYFEDAYLRERLTDAGHGTFGESGDESDEPDDDDYDN